jgi:hypothetical protein
MRYRMRELIDLFCKLRWEVCSEARWPIDVAFQFGGISSIDAHLNVSKLQKI